MIDLAIVYTIFLSFQFLLAPMFIAFGYFVAVIRLSLPYILMYILICIFINLPYRKNYTIKFLKYSIDIKAAQNTKIYIYLSQYNYIIIFSINFLILFIIYYSYINNKYFYLFFIFLFYFFIWIIIKIKHYLLKNVNLQAKRVHMFVNIILVVLVGVYISMSLEDLHISNFKFFGFEHFWKLIDNKFFIKYSFNNFKDYNWNRVFNLSRQVSQDRYMHAIKKELIKSNLIDINQSKEDSLLNDNLPISGPGRSKSLILKEKIVFSNNIKNDDINLNTKFNLSDYFLKSQNKDYNSNLNKFTNSFYNKFKKVFLINVKIKTSNFIPVSEINERQKLINWLHSYSSAIDLSEYYINENIDKDIAYNNYLDLVDKNFNNWTTKKVFLILLNKNKNIYNLKNFVFFADYTNTLKKNHILFLNNQKQEFDFSNSLDFEYTNIDLYQNSDFKTLWNIIKNEIFILFKENKVNFISKKFKSLYTIKIFNFSLKEDVLFDSDLEILLKTKPKAIIIPDFKKLLIWKTFKLNYKEIICQYAIYKKLQSIEFNKWYKSNSLISNKKAIVYKSPNDIYFAFDDDIFYVLSDYKELYQVEDLEFDDLLPSDEHKALFDYIQNYLLQLKSRTDLIAKISKSKYIKIIPNELDKVIHSLQDTRLHVSKFSSLYHELLWQNSNNFFKSLIKNIEFTKTILISIRTIMDYESWLFITNKILNLKIDSFYLKNLNDFSLEFKDDLTGDLKFNFSLAFKILQSKYDLTLYQMIPDLEGIPGTFYEYTVKYNAHMANYFWYEEQEELIDWIYEISYDALVELMDAVKEVEAKEDDFLFDMLNACLLDKQYKWVPELHNKLILKENVNVSLDLIKINEDLEVFNKIELINESKQLLLLQPDTIDLDFIESLNKQMHIMDFRGIKNIEQLNLKLGRDLHIMKYLVRWQKLKLAMEIPDLIEYFNNRKTKVLDNKIIQIFGKVYSETQNIDNIDIGASVGVGYFVDSNYTAEDLLEIEVLDDFLEDQSEVRLMLKQEYFLDEIDYIMQNDNDLLDQEEELISYFEDMFFDIQKNYERFMYNYMIQFKKAQIKVLDNMMEDIRLKKKALALIDIECDYLDKIKEPFLEIRNKELYEIYLQELPIFDWSTNSILYENIEILMEKNPLLLSDKLDKLSVELDKANSTMLTLKKNTKLYGEQFKAYTKWSHPVAKQYIETKWTDYNFNSNKRDKFIHDLFKKRK
jgi:hypothetical protein